MTDLIDTSIVLRYLLQDVPLQAEKARELIDATSPVRLPVVAISESAFVLMRVYGVDRATVVSSLQALISRRNIEVHEIPKSIAIEALELCRPSNRVSFADALLWAAARAAPSATIVTFDRRFPRDGGVTRVLSA